MRKLETMANVLNDDFRTHLADAAHENLGIEIVSEWSFVHDRLVTRRVGGNLTKRQKDWLHAYSEGYGKALDLVRRADRTLTRSVQTA